MIVARVRYEQAAAHLGVKPATLRSMVFRKQVPHIRLSKRLVVFDLGDLERWIDEHRVPARAAS